MKRNLTTLRNIAIASLLFSFAACSKDKDAVSPADLVAANINKYTEVWDGILNGRNLNGFNTANFDKNVVFHASPSNIVGIDAARAYYANFLTGFSDIRFEIKNIFGQGNKLTKHWVFSGKHTGDFFGLAPKGKSVSLQGSTIVRMENGIIMEEQDFFDNLDMLTQLGY